MKFGDKLANGASVIAHRADVVLACWDKGPFGPMEYVTWLVGPNTVQDTYCGNYFLDLKDAVDNFYRRSNRI